MASADALTITLHGMGGHGSRPETTIDPVILAAATTLRLNGIVSREIAANSSAVLTIGQLRAGSKRNVIADQATLGLSLRTFDEDVRRRILGAIGRVVRGEASASGAEREPDIVQDDYFPATVNDAEATDPVAVAAALPSNHSSRFAPVIQPTLDYGVGALVAAARGWLEGADCS